MRQPNGQMSKKDRRACLAFGITPSEERETTVNALWTSRYLGVNMTSSQQRIWQSMLYSTTSATTAMRNLGVTYHATLPRT